MGLLIFLLKNFDKFEVYANRPQQYRKEYPVKPFLKLNAH